LALDENEIIERYNQSLPEKDSILGITSTFETTLGQQFEKTRVSIVKIFLVLAVVILIVTGFGYLYTNQNKIFHTGNKQQSNLSSRIVGANEVTLNLGQNLSNKGLKTKSSEIPMPLINTAQTPQAINKSKDDFRSNVSANLSHLTFNFQGDCWVKITDANNNVLAIGIKRKGKTMKIEGKPPFNIILGNPAVVSLLYNHNAVDLTTYPQGKPATFTLPVGGQ